MLVAHSLPVGSSMLGADSMQWLLPDLALGLLGVLVLSWIGDVCWFDRVRSSCCSCCALSASKTLLPDTSHGRGEVCGVGGIEICLTRLLSVLQCSSVSAGGGVVRWLLGVS